MAYQDGIATDPLDLLQKIVLFLQTNGWTINMSQAETSDTGGTAGWRAHVSKGAVYANMKAQMGSRWYRLTNVYSDDDLAAPPGIGLNLSTGYDSGLVWSRQPGAPVISGITINIVGQILNAAYIPSYHCFLDAADNFICVIEAAYGFYGYIGFGPSINKVGGWAQGQYYFGSSHGYYMSHIYSGVGLVYNSATPFAGGSAAGGASNLFVKMDIDTNVGHWLSAGTSTGAETTLNYLRASIYGGSITVNNAVCAPYYYGDGNVAANCFQTRQFTQFNAQAMFLPAHLFVDRDAGGVSYIGSGPNVYYSSATLYGTPANSLLPIGADSYRVYPNFCVKQV